MQPSEDTVHAAVLCDGEGPSAAVLQDLGKEIVQVHRLEWSSLHEEPPQDLKVLLLWMSTARDRERVREAVQWAQRGARAVTVLGCAPDGDLDDSVHAFEAGVDDFVAGRCSARELACRIRALYRRMLRTSSARDLRCRNLIIDPSAREVMLGRQAIRLTSTELSVLRALVEAQGEALTRTSLLDRAWGDCGLEIGERAVDNVVLRLRRKLGSAHVIETVRGIGFRLALE